MARGQQPGRGHAGNAGSDNRDPEVGCRTVLHCGQICPSAVVVAVKYGRGGRVDHCDPNQSGCRIVPMQAIAQMNVVDGRAGSIRRYMEVGPSPKMPIKTGTKGTMGPAELARLIEAIAATRDRAAFTALFDHFAPRIKGLLMRSNTPAAAAEELAQEAMLTVWRKAAQFDRTRAGASAWIFTIARNLRIDIARREQRGKVLDLESGESLEQPAQPDAEFDAGEREQRVRAALSHLPDDQMRVVRLSFFESKPHAEIAIELEMPLGTVKSRIRLAMKHLRGLLGDLT
ncbi:MAG: sigma-70 family RNA polymerase sigma factor [Pseudolabrys sp.]